MLNLEMLRRLRDLAVKQPDHWEQSAWFSKIDSDHQVLAGVARIVVGAYDGNVEEWSCGTAACAAGHAALMEGWRPYRGDSGYSNFVEKDGKCLPVCEVGRDALGLNSAQAFRLFYATNETIVSELDSLIDEAERRRVGGVMKILRQLDGQEYEVEGEGDDSWLISTDGGQMWVLKKYSTPVEENR